MDEDRKNEIFQRLCARIGVVDLVKLYIYLEVFHKITGLFCISLLLLAPLAPLASAMSADCDCEHVVVSDVTLRPIPCCDLLPHSCCLKSDGERPPLADPLIEGSTSPRLRQPEYIELLSPVLPVQSFWLKTVRSPRSERPPGELCQELSFIQSWLI